MAKIKHAKYKITEDEIRNLLSLIIKIGEKDTYYKIKDRISMLNFNTENLDEICMDIHESMLKKARDFDLGKDKEALEIRSNFYQLSSILRILAHEFHKLYKNEDRNKRFIELVHYSKENLTYRHK